MRLGSSGRTAAGGRTAQTLLAHTGGSQGRLGAERRGAPALSATVGRRPQRQVPAQPAGKAAAESILLLQLYSSRDNAKHYLDEHDSAGGRKQPNGGRRLRDGRRQRRAHSSSCLIRCERRVRVGFCELLLACDASAKNLKMDGKLFQEVSSWRSVPAETRGQSGSMDSTDVSNGSELETQLQQFSLIHSRMVLPAS